MAKYTSTTIMVSGRHRTPKKIGILGHSSSVPILCGCWPVQIMARYFCTKGIVIVHLGPGKIRIDV